MTLNKSISNVFPFCLRISFIRQYLTVKAAKTLVCAFVLPKSKLDNCNLLLSGCPFYLLTIRLHKVQKFAANLVFKARKRDHVQPLHHALHWFPVQARIDHKLWIICHDLFSHSSSAYFSDLFNIVNDFFSAQDDHKLSFLSLLDRTAAFVTIDHCILWPPLNTSFGLPSSILSWFHSLPLLPHLHGFRQ